MPQIVWTAILDGRVTYFNAWWYRYTGLERDGRRRIGDIVHPDNLAVVLGRRAAAFATGTLYETWARLRRADGVYRC